MRELDIDTHRSSDDLWMNLRGIENLSFIDLKSGSKNVDLVGMVGEKV